MLTEKRYGMILELLEKKRTITVTELTELLHTSESTVRRDLNALDRAGKLVKVFGGAVTADMPFHPEEPSVAQKMELMQEEKKRIAEHAANLIKPGDFIYLDAGTTTGFMIDFMVGKNVTIVTNAVDHARRLAAAGMRVLLIGGELKGTTEAVVGNHAILSLQDYHFSKGFFGTNGLSKKEGLTTPDYNEAIVKKTAVNSCRERYVLCDSAKFGNISSVTFAPVKAVKIITDKAPAGIFADDRNIIVAP